MLRLDWLERGREGCDGGHRGVGRGEQPISPAEDQLRLKLPAAAGSHQSVRGVAQGIPVCLAPASWP